MHSLSGTDMRVVVAQSTSVRGGVEGTRVRRGCLGTALVRPQIRLPCRVIRGEDVVLKPGAARGVLDEIRKKLGGCLSVHQVNDATAVGAVGLADLGFQ